MKCFCEVHDGKFLRFAALYREGLHAFRQYAARGICVDGTFIKTFVGGILLVACFRNGNKELQIIGVAVVSIEYEDNWTFFLQFISEHLDAPPSFIISDRDKGLTPAVKSTFPTVHHYYCFRHLMENFNRVFKSKELKNMAWLLARAITGDDFDKQEKNLRERNRKAADWLLHVGKEKWSLFHGPSPRYAMMTSNNVESINNALRGIRKYPVLDMLMAIERYVGTKWYDKVSKPGLWNTVTNSGESLIARTLQNDLNCRVSTFNDSAFLVTVHSRGQVPVEYSVSLNGPTASCSCNYGQDARAPCLHTVVCMRATNRMNDVYGFFDATWRSDSFHLAYSLGEGMHWPPPVLKDAVEIGECAAPKIQKKRGRPKGKKRRESQYATLQLTKKRKTHKCSVCGSSRHNKRHHQVK